jgi:uncharacterized surface protein with fasciclin (FAS1) repeats
MQTNLKIMKKVVKLLSFAMVTLIGSSNLMAQNNTVIVGGEQMFPQKNIIQNAINSKDHTTLVVAVKSAGLVDALMGKGPFTVFAPNNAAFDKLPEGTLETLLKTENKETLTKILTYHVVAGKYDSKELVKMIEKGKGTAMLKTLAGGELSFMKNGEANVMVKDEKGGISNINIYNVYQSNGVIHSLDTVLMPD